MKWLWLVVTILLLILLAKEVDTFLRSSNYDAANCQRYAMERGNMLDGKVIEKHKVNFAALIRLDTEELCEVTLSQEQYFKLFVGDEVHIEY